MVMEGGVVRSQEEIKREKVVEAIGSLKNGKAVGVDEISAEMLKYGGESVTEWIHRICQMPWEQERILEDWTELPLFQYPILYMGKSYINEVAAIEV